VLAPFPGNVFRQSLKPLSHGSVAPTIVISTEAKRSGEISVLTPFPGNVFRQSVA
jgi:hypothetical protein